MCLVTPEIVDVSAIRFLRKAFDIVIGVEVIIPPDSQPLTLLGACSTLWGHHGELECRGVIDHLFAEHQFMLPTSRCPLAYSPLFSTVLSYQRGIFLGLMLLFSCSRASGPRYGPHQIARFSAHPILQNNISRCGCASSPPSIPPLPSR